MKTALLNKLQCLNCGAPLEHLSGTEQIVCDNCGEVFDLRTVSSMELELDDFNKLLLCTLKKRRIGNRNKHD
jgi:hypothetical protein